jgi:hypothetical protein
MLAPSEIVGPRGIRVRKLQFKNAIAYRYKIYADIIYEEILQYHYPAY